MPTSVKPVWRVLPHRIDPIARALAGADGLFAGLAAGGPPTVRWYGASGLGVVVGSGQHLRDVDAAALRAAGGTLHKRSSGGAAVLFTPEFLMQDVALPLDHPLYRSDVTESYRWLGEVWVDALARLGIAAELIDIDTARRDTAERPPIERKSCFAGRSPYEVLADGRKIVGFSQIRRRSGAVLQVGVYRALDHDRLAQLLAVDEPERAWLGQSSRTRVASLAELRDPPPSMVVVMSAFADALAAQHGEAAISAWTDEELAAQQAAEGRYGAVSPP